MALYGTTSGDDGWLFWGIETVVFLVIHQMESSNVRDPDLLPSRWWIVLLTPAYLYRRAKALRQPLTSFWVMMLIVGTYFWVSFSDGFHRGFEQAVAKARQGQTATSKDGAQPKLVDPLVALDAKKVDELTAGIKSTEAVIIKMWDSGVRDRVGGAAQLAMIRNTIVPMVREDKSRVEQFEPLSSKFQPVKARLVDLVQTDFSAWIAVNNAAATGNWDLAQNLFDQRRIDLAEQIRKLNLELDKAR
jgi:hypothetical protein